MTASPKRFTVIAGLMVAALPQFAAAQQTCAPRPVAVFQSVRNSVQLVQASTRAAIQAARQVPVCAGDTIRVGDDSRAVVVMLGSNTPLVIDQNSEFIVTDAPAASGSFVDLLRGALLFITRVRRSIEIRTPFVNAAIEGTEFVVRVEADRTIITVFEGTVRATNPQGMVLVGAGQQAVAVQGQAPQLQIIVRPRDAVQWALYYEPVLPSDSFEQLAAIPVAARDATFYVRRAGLLLSAGQLGEAQADLDQAQRLDPSNGNAYALRAIVAVALNDTGGALESGRMAVERAPGSSAARIALSYALQANLQLEAARDAVEQAVEADPRDGAAWARLAELRLMLDDIGGAVEAARRSTVLAPQVARTQSALGFALLAQLKLTDARNAFEEAIALEPDNPLAHLGLGLARIRQGRLAEGRADLELAEALNPDSSLIRSYLGKAYFEEKRDALADEQIDGAKNLDPMDPTPWFYGAIQKQTLNRPVEALRDLQRSVQLNGNRAVYRSRLLLDQDLAVRGARLGRIYRDLGFEHLALLEGWKSLAVDPANHSAHRLLADSYLALPRHGIARDSELLQAQLLQPVNINPVQPLVADNGLTYLDDTGPASAGFSEFTRLFAANRLQLTADGIAGQRATRADNVILSGIFNRLSYSVGQSHYETDGVRPNNGLRQDVYNAFLQADLSPLTAMQVEIRSSDAELGDRRLLFLRDNFLIGQRNTVRVKSARLGGRRVLRPNSIVIGSYTHRALDGVADAGPGLLRSQTSDKADFVETRYLQGWGRANVTGGLGYYKGELTSGQRVGAIVLPTTTTPIRHLNGYVLGTANVLRGLAIFAGLGGDRLERAALNRRQFNPKFGVAWSMTPATMVRAAAFRSLKRTLVSSQTLEPTQVAGFNQFFDDANSTDAWRYGLAIDQSIRANVSIGAEASLRKMKVPVFLAGSRTPTDTDREDQFATIYAYATPARWLAINTDYRYEHLIREPNARNADLVARSRIHKASGEVRAFHASGLFVRFRESFIDQHGRFLNARAVIVNGADSFWIADASAGYRLPRQRGMFTVDVRNAFDSTFSFQDSTPRESTIMPVRIASARLTLTF